MTRREEEGEPPVIDTIQFPDCRPGGGGVELQRERVARMRVRERRGAPS